MKQKKAVYRGSLREQEELQREKRQQYRKIGRRTLLIQCGCCLALLALCVGIRQAPGEHFDQLRWCLMRSLNVTTDVRSLPAFWEDIEKAKDAAISVFAPDETKEDENRVEMSLTP